MIVVTVHWPISGIKMYAITDARYAVEYTSLLHQRGYQFEVDRLG